MGKEGVQRTLDSGTKIKAIKR